MNTVTKQETPMIVKLIAKTQPLVGKEQVVGGPPVTIEEFVSYVARVSNPDNQLNTSTAPRLLKYLLDNGHISPFEHTFLSFEITTTRDISRQILRHRSFTFQEYSGRYSQMSNAKVPRETRLQDNKNRQNSLENFGELTDKMFKDSQDIVWNTSVAAYRNALNMGVAKEQARALLPEGLTKTTLIMTGSLRSWIHYITARADSSTQKEHRLIAEEIRATLKTEFPVTGEVLGW